MQKHNRTNIIDEKITMVPFNQKWNELYSLEANRIQEKLKNKIIDIQHIGSTSISNSYAKPIIDIMMGIKNLNDSELIINIIVELGYEFLGDANVAERFYFRKRNKHNYNIALCEYHSEIWNNNILFRDYLRKHPDIVAHYNAIKKNAFESGADTLLKYSEMKKSFIEEILKKAKKESK